MNSLFAGQEGERLLHQPAQLGARELRVPEEQDKEVQRASSAAHPGVLQVPAADPQQGAGEPAQLLLRQLQERLVRPKRLDRLRHQGLGRAGHLHKGQDREVGFSAGRGRDAEQDIRLLHTHGEVSGLEEGLAAHDAGRDPHQLHRGEEAAHAAHLRAARLPPPGAGERAAVPAQHAQLAVQEAAGRALPQDGRGRVGLRGAQRGAAARRQLQAVVAPAAKHQPARAAAEAARAAAGAPAGRARAAGYRGARGSGGPLHGAPAPQGPGLRVRQRQSRGNDPLVVQVGH